MNVLYLDHAPVFGGAERVLLNLVTAMGDSPYRPVVATRPDSPLSCPLMDAGVELYTVPFPRLRRAGVVSPQTIATVRKLSRLVRERPIDLIHSNTARTHIIGALVAKLTGTPLVWMLHDDTLPPMATRLLASVPRKVVTVSNWLADFYCTRGLEKNVVTIHNGVALPAATSERSELRKRLGLDPETPLVLQVGRLIEEKGPHIFIAAAKGVLREFPKARFLIVGGFDEERADYRVDLQRQIDQTRSIVMIGHQEEVNAFYAAANLVVYCATEPEGLPMVLLEAMAWARPVVASRLGGAVEIVVEKETGFLVPPNDPAAAADAILKLLKDPAAAGRMGSAARHRIEKFFNLTDLVTRIQQVYAEATG